MDWQIAINQTKTLLPYYYDFITQEGYEEDEGNLQHDLVEHGLVSMLLGEEQLVFEAPQGSAEEHHNQRVEALADVVNVFLRTNGESKPTSNEVFAGDLLEDPEALINEAWTKLHARGALRFKELHKAFADSNIANELLEQARPTN